MWEVVAEDLRIGLPSVFQPTAKLQLLQVENRLYVLSSYFRNTARSAAAERRITDGTTALQQLILAILQKPRDACRDAHRPEDEG